MSPVTSRAQGRFMVAIAGGAIKKKGLSAEKAQEFIRGQSLKSLPSKAKKGKG